jgi:hypothetical protein
MTDHYAEVVRTQRVIVAERSGQIVGLVAQRPGRFAGNLALA